MTNRSVLVARATELADELNATLAMLPAVGVAVMSVVNRPAYGECAMLGRVSLCLNFEVQP